MKDSVSVFYINNSGLIFKTANCMVMVDGIVRDDNLFGLQDLPIRENIINEFKYFDGKKILAFTHCHNDHFDDQRTANFIKCGYANDLLLPEDKTEAMECISISESINGITIIKKAKQKFIIEEVEITFFRTNHIEYSRYSDSAHYCILIEIKGMCCMISGDAAPEDFIKLLNKIKKKIDIVFINPIIIGRKEGAGKLAEAIPDIELCVYHLPDVNMDDYGYRKMAQSKYEQYKNFIPKLKLLLENMKYIQ